MTNPQFNDMLEDGQGQLWRYGDTYWYPQVEQQDGYADLEDIPEPRRAVTLIYTDELEHLREDAWKYRDLMNS